MTSQQRAAGLALHAAIKVAAPVLTDALASQAIPLYPVMRYSGLAIQAGTRIN